MRVGFRGAIISTVLLPLLKLLAKAVILSATMLIQHLQSKGLIFIVRQVASIPQSAKAVQGEFRRPGQVVAQQPAAGGKKCDNQHDDARHDRYGPDHPLQRVIQRHMFAARALPRTLFSTSTYGTDDGPW